MKKTLQRVMAFAMVLVTILSMSVSALAYQTKSSNFSKSYSLTSSLASNMAAVAKAQVGKTKSNLGYTEAWCADFVLDCARLAKVDKTIIPYTTSSCAAVSTLFSKMKSSCGATQVSSPKKGDLVFYYCSTCKKYVHVGVVISSSYSVEGNLSSKVYKCKLTSKFTDASGHTTSSGKVTRKYLRPNYSASVTLSPSSATLLVGNTKTLSCNMTTGVTWKSSDTSVATVSSSGKVTAKGKGTATITAIYTSGKKATCKITVKPKVSSTKITLSASSAKLAVGNTKQLSYTLIPSNSTDSVTWKSSNTSVATVSSSGKVTAKKAGTATITATTTSGKTATFKVTVYSYFAKCASSYTSIVDALKSIGATSSYSYRAKIAAANGITNYTGTAAQNIKMLNLLKQGKLIKP